MLVYVLTLLVPGIVALVTGRRSPAPALLLAFPALVILIGLRQKVGMDWNNYLVIQDKVSALAWEEALRTSEPGFALLAWTSEQMGFGIYGSNFVSATLFSLGLVTFASRTKNAALAIVAAVPYLVVVVAMSAARQSAAIGVLLFAFAYWRQSRFLTRIVLILVAASFHLSALFCLAFVVLESRISGPRKIGLLMMSAAALAFIIPGSGHFEYYSGTYLGAGSLESAGGLAHVSLIAGPAAIYLLLRRRWERRFGSDPLLFGMSVLGLLALPAVMVFSTAVDRMSLYLYALPMMVYANGPHVIASGGALKLVQLVIVGVHLVLLMLWLQFSNSAFAYVPYGNVLFR